MGELISETKYKNGKEILTAEQKQWMESASAGAAAVDAAKAAGEFPWGPYTKDAEAAAEELGITCQTNIRAEQCVIAYFDKNDQPQNSRRNAKYYRVLYGQVNDLFIAQDFYSSGKKQSNVFYSRSYGSLLSSFNNSDLYLQGNVKGYDAKGRMTYSEDYQSGEPIEYAADATAVEDEAVGDATKAAAGAAVDAAKAAAAVEP